MRISRFYLLAFLADARSRIRTLCAALLVFACPCVLPDAACGDQGIKRLVRENCDRAREMLKAQSAEERAQLIPYLREVLKLKTQPPSNPMVASVPLVMGTPQFGVENPTGDVWRAFGPDMEINARRCASTLLKMIGAQGVSAIPELVDAANESVIPDELRLALEDSAVAIASSRPIDAPDGAAVDDLSRHLLGEYGQIAANVLTLLPAEQVVPQILALLRRVDSASSDALIEATKWIEWSGPQMGALLALTESNDPELLGRVFSVVSRFRGPLNDADVRVAQFLSHPIPGVQDAALRAVDERIREAPLLLECTGRVPECVDRVERFVAPFVGSFGEGSSSLRARISPILQKFASEGLVDSDACRRLIDRARSDDDLRARMIPVLSLVKSPPEFAINAIEESLYSPQIGTRLAAIRGLARSPIQSDELFSAFLKLLKSNSREQDSGVRDQILLAVLEDLPAALPQSNQSRVFPYIRSALSVPVAGAGEHPVRRIAQKMGPESLSFLLPALQRGTPQERVEASEALPELPNLDRRSIGIIAERLDDEVEQVRLGAFTFLNHSFPLVRKLLEHAVDGKETEGTRLAAQILALNGVSHAPIPAILAQAVAEAPCGKKIEYIRAWSRVTDSETIQIAAIKCFSASPADPMSGLQMLAALDGPSEETKHKVDELLAQNRDRTDLLLYSYREHLAATFDSGRIVDLLDGKGDVELLEILSVLETLPDIGPQIAERLENIARKGDVSADVRCRIVRLLEPRPRESIDWKRLLRTASEQEGWIPRRCFSEFPPNFLLPVVKETIGEVAEQHRRYLISLIGTLGPAAASERDYLRTVLATENGELRYSALVSLLRVSRESDDLGGSIRWALSSRFNRNFLREDLPASSLVPLRAIAAAPNNQLERVLAPLMVREIEHRTKGSSE